MELERSEPLCQSIKYNGARVAVRDKILGIRWSLKDTSAKAVVKGFVPWAVRFPMMPRGVEHIRRVANRAGITK